MGPGSGDQLLSIGNGYRGKAPARCPEGTVETDGWVIGRSRGVRLGERQAAQFFATFNNCASDVLARPSEARAAAAMNCWIVDISQRRESLNGRKNQVRLHRRGAVVGNARLARTARMIVSPYEGGNTGRAGHEYQPDQEQEFSRVRHVLGVAFRDRRGGQSDEGEKSESLRVKVVFRISAAEN